MKNLVDIKNRIKAVSDTRQITNAMETISVAKMRKASERLEANKAYFNTLRETIADIAFHTFVEETEYFSERGDKKAYIVIASDKGLAGSFNHNVLNFALKKVAEGGSVFTMGQVAHEFFVNKGFKVFGDFVGATYDPSVIDASEIAGKVLSLFKKKEFDKFYIVYSALEHGAIAVPKLLQLLPLSDISDRPLTDEKIEEISEIEYEPSAEFVLDKLVSQYLCGMVYGALVNSVAAEHFVRRAAMNNATTNADEILETLSVEYNRARQEIVTNQITEIITSSIGIAKK